MVVLAVLAGQGAVSRWYYLPIVSTFLVAAGTGRPSNLVEEYRRFGIPTLHQLSRHAGTGVDRPDTGPDVH